MGWGMASSSSPRPTRDARTHCSKNQPHRAVSSLSGVVRRSDHALFVSVPHVEDAEEILGARQGLPAFGEEVLGDDLLVGKLEHGHTPLVEGVFDFDGVVALLIEIAHIALLIASSAAVDGHGLKYIPRTRSRGTGCPADSRFYHPFVFSQSAAGGLPGSPA